MFFQKSLEGQCSRKSSPFYSLMMSCKYHLFEPQSLLRAAGGQQCAGAVRRNSSKKKKKNIPEVQLISRGSLY